jgi:hypothetical protein
MHELALNTDDLIKGLKHYRRIAKQDIVRSGESSDQPWLKDHATARREVYARLAELAAEQDPEQVVQEALDWYKQLPFVTGTEDGEHVEVKGQENALENFFLMVGLAPKVRREYRSQRPSLGSPTTS